MIKSNAFGGVQLTGEDATKFERQVRYAKPSQAAQETLRRGDTLLQRFGEGVLVEGRSEQTQHSKVSGRAKVRITSS